jgi:hypothetical protein
METLISDPLWLIFIKLAPSDLTQICKTNKRFRGICKNEEFKKKYDDVWHVELKKRYKRNPTRGLLRAAEYGYEDLFPYFMEKLPFVRPNAKFLLLTGLAQTGNEELLDKYYEIFKAEDEENVDRMEPYIRTGLENNPDYLQALRLRNKYIPGIEIIVSPASGNVAAMREMIELTPPESRDIIFADLINAGLLYFSKKYPEYSHIINDYKIEELHDNRFWKQEADALYYAINGNYVELKKILQDGGVPTIGTLMDFVLSVLDFPLEATINIVPYLDRRFVRIYLQGAVKDNGDLDTLEYVDSFN